MEATLTNTFLKPGYIIVTQKPVIISLVLGSSVAVCIWDRKNMFGGMCHFIYPICKQSEGKAVFGNAAIIGLLRVLKEFGSVRENLEAQIFGGAYIDKETRKNAKKNVLVAVKMMKKYKIPVVSQDTGGCKGRKIAFQSLTNEVMTLRVDKIRQGDWYPYISNRL